MVSSRNFYCLECGACFGGKGNGKCPTCGGRLKRDDLMEEEDYADLAVKMTARKLKGKFEIEIL